MERLKYTINYVDSEDILFEQEKIEKKWQNSNTLDTPHTSKILQKKKYMPGSEQCGAVLEKNPQGNTSR